MRLYSGMNTYNGNHDSRMEVVKARMEVVKNYNCNGWPLWASVAMASFAAATGRPTYLANMRFM